jgi:hypothetical protein
MRTSEHSVHSKGTRDSAVISTNRGLPERDGDDSRDGCHNAFDNLAVAL